MLVSIICSSLMWALVAVLVIFRRRSGERSITYAAIAIGAAMLLAITPLYVIVDGWLGERDFLHLGRSILLMIGLFFVARGVARADDLSRPGLKVILSAPYLWVAAVVCSIAFFLVEPTPGTTTSFIADHGDDPATLAYLGVLFLYIAGVLYTMMIVSARQLRSRDKLTLAASLLMLVASLVGLGMSAEAVLLGVALVTGHGDVAAPFAGLFLVLQTLTFVFLCAGLAATPLARWVAEARRARDARAMLDRLRPLWVEATAARPSVRDAFTRRSEHPEAQLHRQIVEIRDAARDTRNDFRLGADDRRMLAAAEAQLMGGPEEMGQATAPPASSARRAR